MSRAARYKIMYMNNTWSPWMTQDELENVLKVGDVKEVIGIQSEEIMTRKEARERYGIDI